MTEARARRSGWLMFTVTPYDWLLLAFMVLSGGGIWLSSAKLLVTSGWRENGRVLSCIYFTGTDVIEWQYMNKPGGGELACPIIKLG